MLRVIARAEAHAVDRRLRGHRRNRDEADAGEQRGENLRTLHSKLPPSWMEQRNGPWACQPLYTARILGSIAVQQPAPAYVFGAEKCRDGVFAHPAARTRRA